LVRIVNYKLSKITNGGNSMETVDVTRIISETLVKLGYVVATNKRNTLGLPRFHTQGVGNSVPDIFFYNPEFEEEIFDPEFIPSKNHVIRGGFLELKSGEHLIDLIDGASQVARYYGYFITNKAKIFFNGRQIHNIDCFLLATGWSPFGMIYKEDDSLFPLTVSYISERYAMVATPFTLMLHSLIRYFQQNKKKELRRNKLRIPKNKMNVETGIMISKIPNDENLDVSYEFYAWLGRRVDAITTNLNDNVDYIKVSVKIIEIREQSISVETGLRKKLWIPISVVKSNGITTAIEAGTRHSIEIKRWFYDNKKDFFGIT
jgi:hypothetical protein